MLQLLNLVLSLVLAIIVSNPISGEVGAAACQNDADRDNQNKFQTPSAGRWVLQRGLPCSGSAARAVSNPISGEVGAAAGEAG